MDSEISKLKNLKVIYEQRRERIQSRLEDMNLKESMVSSYQNMRHQFGIVEGTCMFIMSLILCSQFFDKFYFSLLLSGGVGFSFISFYNAFKYKKLKNFREEHPDIDFDNYDFDSNFVIKNQLHSEIQKIDAALYSLENSFNYDLIDVSHDCISYVDNNNYDFSFSSNHFYDTESVDFVKEPQNSYVLVKKLERK